MMFPMKLYEISYRWSNDIQTRRMTVPGSQTIAVALEQERTTTSVVMTDATNTGRQVDCEIHNKGME